MNTDYITLAKIDFLKKNLFLFNEKIEKIVEKNNEKKDFQAMIDEFWDKYDDDNSGELDKEETKKFA